MARTDFSIRPMRESDWESVRAIYIQGIATGNATFAATAPEWQDWDQTHLLACRLVAEYESSVIGWAALSPYSRREVYSGVAEVSVYVAESARGRRVGSALLSALVKLQRKKASGLCKPASSRKTRRAFSCIAGAGSALSGNGNVSGK
jgi:phosphinothricin acetyltransferase